MFFHAPLSVGIIGLSIRLTSAPIVLAIFAAASISEPGELPKVSPRYSYNGAKPSAPPRSKGTKSEVPIFPLSEV